MTLRASVERYLGAVSEQYRHKDATENSYCDGLKQLWEGIGPEVSNSRTKLTVLPARRRARLRSNELRWQDAARIQLGIGAISGRVRSPKLEFKSPCLSPPLPC